MIKKLFFPTILFLLAWVLFSNPTIKEVSAGVAILLFGMIMLEDGFNTFVEGPVQKLLKRMTNRLYKSLGVGFIVTALLQSSSLISVISISFLSAGLIDLFAGIGIVFGADIGTTATAWLVAAFGLKVKVSSFAMPMLAFGILFVFQKRRTMKGIGYVLAGLGFFFLGIHYMKQGFDTFQDGINLAEYAVPGFWGIISYTAIGILVTLILQSSSAAIALFLTALAAGQITYENSLALTIGANVGTTITAILGSLSANNEGKKLAGAQLIFKASIGLIALILISPFGQLVKFLADGFGIAADNYILRLALFHSVFNIIGVLIMLPFIPRLVILLNRIFPTKKKEEKIENPIYLNESVLTYPQTSIRALLDESKRLFENATFEIIAHGLNLHIHDIKGDEKLKSIVKKSKEKIKVNVNELYYEKVKTIYSKIIKYATLSQSKFSLDTEAMEAFTRVKIVNRNIVEVIKYIRGLRTNVSKYMVSDNEAISKEYDKLRKKVSKVLREIYLLSEEEEPQEHLTKLTKIKSNSKKVDVLIDGTLDELIREKKISSEMAASLANDSARVTSITLKLIETAELLYINHDTLIQATEENDVSTTDDIETQETPLNSATE
ncbi:MAG: Na/Pi cotransporter family protein [Bacteroidia bacterium]